HDALPTSMALDEPDHCLFVGCRRPARLLVLDTASGAQVASLPIAADTDDLFYDPARHQLYVLCGGGSIDILSQRDPSHYEALAQLPTAAGARTGLWVPDQSRLYLAVPHRGRQATEI